MMGYLLKVKFTSSLEIEVAGDNVDEVRKLMDDAAKKFLDRKYNDYKLSINSV